MVLYYVMKKMSPLLLIILVALVGLQVTLAEGKIDCRRVVFHPSCRGISAKRSNLQMENANLIANTDNMKQRQLVDLTDYSELEREETPELDIPKNRRRGVNHSPEEPAPMPSTTPVSTSPRPKSSVDEQRPFTPNFSLNPPKRATPGPSIVTPVRPWKDNSGIIPPRHSSFYFGLRRPVSALPDHMKPRQVKHPIFPSISTKIEWLARHRSEEHNFSNQL